MDTDEPAVTLSRLAYDEALGAVARQQHVLDSLRGRAATLLSGAAIATSYFGGQAVVAGHVRVTTWCAIGCFVIVGLTATAALWPNMEVETTSRPFTADDVRALRELDGSTAPVLRALAHHLRASYEENEAHVARIVAVLRTCTVFLTFEVVWWVVDLATRG